MVSAELVRGLDEPLNEIDERLVVEQRLFIAADLLRHADRVARIRVQLPRPVLAHLPQQGEHTPGVLRVHPRGAKELGQHAAHVVFADFEHERTGHLRRRCGLTERTLDEGDDSTGLEDRRRANELEDA